MTPSAEDLCFLDLAVDLARQGARSEMGGPFGALVVCNGQIIGQGHNLVTGSNDPTAHAEIVAIREACRKTASFQLQGCTLYSSCEPCPMCLGAIYWARPDKVWYAATRQDAARVGFDDAHIYQEISREPLQRAIPFYQVERPQCREVFAIWKSRPNHVPY
jgi:guanine deaminase